ncbi:MAG: hypothetical protein RhofKO_32480 [Rhodothermales bacterium]
MTRRLPLEALIWTAGLIALACTNPNAPGLFDLCVFKWLGFSGCPGCGLGHAIAHLFRGEWLASWQAHPLGVPALLVLVGRIVTLLRAARRPSPTLSTI